MFPPANICFWWLTTTALRKGKWKNHIRNELKVKKQTSTFQNLLSSGCWMLVWDVMDPSPLEKKAFYNKNLAVLLRAYRGTSRCCHGAAGPWALIRFFPVHEHWMKQTTHSVEGESYMGGDMNETLGCASDIKHVYVCETDKHVCPMGMGEVNSSHGVDKQPGWSLIPCTYLSFSSPPPPLHGPSPLRAPLTLRDVGPGNCEQKKTFPSRSVYSLLTERRGLQLRGAPGLAERMSSKNVQKQIVRW